MVTLQREDVTVVRETLRDVISSHLSRSVPEDGQALGGDLVGVLVTQALLPILISLVSSAVYDVVKTKALRSLTKKEAEDLVDSLVGADLKSEPSLDADCLDRLKEELGSLGMTAKQILAAYELIRGHVLSRQKVDPGGSIRSDSAECTED